MKLRLIFLALTIVAVTSFAAAQAQRGTLVHEESIRVSPSADAAKLGQAGRGHELVIIESSRDWTHVEAILREPRKDADEDDPESEGKTITGWVSSKALVSLTTPNGDKIVFGEAAATPRKTPCASTIASMIYSLPRRSPLKDSTAPPTSAGKWSAPMC